MNIPKLGVSDFARGRHKPEEGKTFFNGTWDELLSMVAANWDQRRAGRGEKDTTRKICVPVAPDRFSDMIHYVADENTLLDAYVDRRQPDEDPYIANAAKGIILSRGIGPEGQDEVKLAPLPARRPTHAYAVLYSADALTENNGKRSGDFDWEIVAIIGTDVPDEPMKPLVMARNFLQKTGGTFSDYSAREFAESIWYWSQRCSAGSSE